MARTGRFAKGTARREEILQTATEILSRNSYHGTSMRSIGRELGLEPANILYYFDSREDLIQNVISRWDDDALRHIGGDFQPATALDNYASIIRHNLEIPGLVHLYLAFAAEAADEAHAAHHYFRRRFDTARGILSSAVAFEKDAGLIPAHVDPDRTARMLIAIADGVQLQALIDPVIDAPTDLDEVIAYLRDRQPTADAASGAPSGTDGTAAA